MWMENMFPYNFQCNYFQLVSIITIIILIHHLTYILNIIIIICGTTTTVYIVNAMEQATNSTEASIIMYVIKWQIASGFELFIIQFMFVCVYVICRSINMLNPLECLRSIVSYVKSCVWSNTVLKIMHFTACTHPNDYRSILSSYHHPTGMILRSPSIIINAFHLVVTSSIRIVWISTDALQIHTNSSLQVNSTARIQNRAREPR